MLLDNTKIDSFICLLHISGIVLLVEVILNRVFDVLFGGMIGVGKGGLFG
jgi:hypothetical protein